jgi:ABC-type Fe3+ transport system permease subunit
MKWGVVMARQHKSKKQAQPSQAAASQKDQRQSRVRKAFTVVICVVVALGLMLPVAGLGVVSCSPTQDQQYSSGTSD